MPPTITKWKWATTKYVSCRWMSVPSVAEEQPGQPADGEQHDEAEREEHRRLERDRPAIERRRPVEDLDGRLGTATSMLRKLNSRAA